MEPRLDPKDPSAAAILEPSPILGSALLRSREFCQLLLGRAVAGQDERDRPCAGHGGRGAALQRAAPQQLAADHE